MMKAYRMINVTLNIDMMPKAFEDIINEIREADLVVSDSSTCTNEKPYKNDPDYKDYQRRDKQGWEIWEMFKEINKKGKYVPCWGKGLKEFSEATEWEKEQNPEISTFFFERFIPKKGN